ncbi:MAG: UvrD-helicase domain-containing protein [Candidatus Pacebacteria bacterium]|nr:UvrD-helicase domain-containing protein [Candidatus Paceibacterota bacterium]
MLAREDKNLLVENLKSKVFDIRSSIVNEIESLAEEEKNISNLYKKSYSAQQDTIMQQWLYVKKRIEQLTYLKQAPFFAKVVYSDGDKINEVYISKFGYSGEGVSSWVAPVAELRFEEIGECEITIPDKKVKKVDLNQKDTYVISEEKIVYYSQEDKSDGVQIVYEDFLSNIKSEFGLSEIVSKIEKEQYKIIQSDPKVELIISGPAGSGKTTICLHRVAYLLQTPETSDVYAGRNMIMFVQDKSTKDYFSSILPKLGIPNMAVTTYFEWGALLVELEDVEEISLSTIDETYVEYLEEKVLILEKGKVKFKKYGKVFEEELDALYKKHLKEKHYAIFSENKRRRKYDYLDITIMLSMMIFEGELYKEDEFHKSLGNGKYKKYIRKIKTEYGMVIVDEFQNYSHDQISLIKKCINKGNKSIVYIGDINQKSLLKPETKNDSDHFAFAKKVELNKVYRNTKQILEFIKNEGYRVEIPENPKTGEDVKKYSVRDRSDLVSKIQEFVSNRKENETMGILCDGDEMKHIIQPFVQEDGKIKVMTKLESQGTEFNSVVCINEIDKNIKHSERFIKIMESINRNSDYIGYTRAVERLEVLLV